MGRLYVFKVSLIVYAFCVSGSLGRLHGRHVVVCSGFLGRLKSCDRAAFTCRCCCAQVFFGMASNLKPRLEALAVYLKQCENEGNFADLRKQQFDLLLSSLETQLAALSFSDGADYVAILRSMSWSEEQRTSLVKVVQDKVLAGQQQVPVGGRQFSQDFTSLLHYLRAEDWRRLMDPTLQSQSLSLHLTELVTHLRKLTLRSASEETWGVLTALLLLHGEARFDDPIQLRSSFLSTKTQGKLEPSQEGGAACSHDSSTPADPNLLDRELFHKVFGDHGPAPVPPQINMQTFLARADIIPLRD